MRAGEARDSRLASLAGRRAGARSARLAALVALVSVAAGCGSSSGGGSCSAVLDVGFQVIEYTGGLKAALWYPTTATASTFAYPGAVGIVGSVAQNAGLARCARFPLVIFSHGDGGCGTQSIVLTEELARHGYIVAAPDHADALCSVDGGPSRGPDTASEPPFTAPDRFTDQSYIGRKQDVETLLAFLLDDPGYAVSIDAKHVAIAGHSLGGYTGTALTGGWSSWKDDRFRAALLLSPYIQPFLIQGTIPAVHVPVMYQGGTLDVGVTPFVAVPTGAYALSNPPKYFADLRAATHFEWTNTACVSAPKVADCLSRDPNAQLIVDYGTAFLDQYLKGVDQPLLGSAGDGLAEYRADAGG